MGLRPLMTLILVSTSLYGGLLLGHPAALRWQERQERQSQAAREEILRRVFIGRQLQLRHFPPGVYAYQEGGTAAAWFESEDGPLESIYRRLPIPARGGPAIKFLIRGDGRMDFTTRGAIRGGGDTRENRLISDRICTALQETPRIGGGTGDEDTRRVHRLIYSALREAVYFRRERYLLPATGRIPPLEILQEDGQWLARHGTTTLRLQPAGAHACRVISLHTEDGTTEDELREAFAPGELREVRAVERAMVHESVVGTVIPVRANGFAGPLLLETGVDNAERLTGIAIVDHNEHHGFGPAPLADGAEFLRQFEGLLINDLGIQGETDGGIVDAVGGATRTCRGVAAGVRDALKFYERLNAEEYGQESDDATL